MSSGGSAELSFALEVCREAGVLALSHFQKGIEATLKEDGTPVTKADKACERLIREAIAGQFPHDDVLGEEEGETFSRSSGDPSGGAGRRKWVIDPIDGTYPYSRGIPIFSTLLALEEAGEIVLGVVHAPAVGDTFWAEAGGGAYKNGQRLSVSSCAESARSQLNFGSTRRILEKGLWDGFQRLVKHSCQQRSYGDYLNFAYFLEGKSEAVLEVGVKPWDLAPMKILAREAGGLYGDLEGGESVYTGSCLIANQHLFKEMLALLLG